MKKQNKELLKIFTPLMYSGIFIIIGFVLLFTVNIPGIQSLDNMSEAGLQTLEPIDTKQKVEEASSTYSRGNGHSKRIYNYVLFQVELNGQMRTIWMRTRDAYGDDSHSVGLDAVRHKKKIERYIFYDNCDIIVSKKYKTLSEYQKSEFIRSFYLIGWVLIFGVLGTIIKYLIYVIRKKFT